MSHRRYGPAQWVLFIVIALGALAALFPFFWMFASATRPASDVLAIPPRWNIGSSLLPNLRTLLEDGFLRAAFNSVLLAVFTTVLTLLLSALGGYAMTFKSRLGGLLFGIILITLFVPAQVTIIPIFKLLAGMQLLGSYWAVILPAIASPFGLFYMRQGFLSFPQELAEAARIDGANEWRVFWHIALPAVRPTLASLAVFVFLFQWNSYFWPLVVLNTPESFTLPLYLSAMSNRNTVDYGAMMLGVSLTTLPVLLLFVFARRLFTSAVLGGAVKG
ncbi:sugar ABC transporter permease [Deinococcus malanensis]|uniref:Sugar ABC transporter permease n=1 Tax=Deinococcus malanensis TaxID=1706855 RepID=A0ABQ2F119_9DEIO|nr:carbohydrate ABC transporter permease [Deinococcus malanensis]GGK38839.1 sugar ABC transporter permease [Deinococcus malanensis]